MNSSPIVLHAKAGTVVYFDASRSLDPDGDALTFHWWQQSEIGTAQMAIDNSENTTITVRLPIEAAGQTLHLICEVHDKGPFHLVSYRRIIIIISD